MRRTALLLLAALAGGSVAAQETFFSESIEIRVINVDVIVTDKKGAPIAGLTKHDFDVFENSARQNITNFYEYRGLPAGAGVESPQTTAAAPATADLRPRSSTYAAFVRGDGVVSEIKTQVHQLRFPAASLDKRREITLKLDVTVDDATNGLSVGVMDDVSRTTGFATVKVATR